MFSGPPGTGILETIAGLYASVPENCGDSNHHVIGHGGHCLCRTSLTPIRRLYHEPSSISSDLKFWNLCFPSRTFVHTPTAAHGQMERLPLLLLEGQWGVEVREGEVSETAKRHG